MVQAVEGSLKRLRTEYIDLYFAHYDDGVTPMEEIMRGFDDLASAGKILYAGLSNFSAWRSAQAATTASLRNWTPLAAVEVEYSLLQRTTEREILPLARAIQLGVLAYSPLAAGVLTGKKEASTPGASSRMGIATEGNTAEVLATLNQIASTMGCELAHVALAWVVAKEAIPVLGVRNLGQLESNLQASAIQLTVEEVQHLDAASDIPLGYPHDLRRAFQR